jgi:tripartite-type tricarboxylate transporter receptor subunit TctC
VPFKGIPEAITETITGRVQFFISPFASVFNLVKEGKAHALAVTSAQRMALTPDLPTVSESGLPGYRWDFWCTLAPASCLNPSSQAERRDHLNTETAGHQGTLGGIGPNLRPARRPNWTS